MADPAALRAALVLKSAVRLSRFSYRQIERQLGLHAGALSRLLNGTVELKLRHVEEICGVIGLPPSRLFRLAYPVDEEQEAGAQMEQALEKLHPRPRPALPEVSGSEPPPPIMVEEIERVVFGALRRFFGELGAPPETRTLPREAREAAQSPQDHERDPRDLRPRALTAPPGQR